MKSCKIEGCSSPIWSKGFCIRHSPKKCLIKPTLSPKKELNVGDIQQIYNFYIGIWNKRKEHRCYNCNTYLGNEAKTYMFDHILEKGNNKYKHLKYEEENICYLCLDCHDRKGRGFLSEKLLKLKELTIEKFFKEKV